MEDNQVESLMAAYKDFLLFRDPLDKLIENNDYDKFKEWLDISKDEPYHTQVLVEQIIPRLEEANKFEWILKLNNYETNN